MKKRVLIWDLPTRLFHWLLVVALAGAWYTSDADRDLRDIHVYFGYFILFLLTFRIVWGFVGTKYSRFSEFFPTQSKIKRYLRAVNSESGVEPAGHNPLGAMMIFVMLVIILLQAVSGLFISDDIFTSGPYYGAVSDEIGKIMSFIHGNLFDLILIAVFVHIAAVLYYVVVKKLNILLPMINGQKTIDDQAKVTGISHSRLLMALIVACIVAGFIYWLVVLNAPIVEEYYF